MNHDSFAASVDFNKITGRINPALHSSNSAPMLATRGLMEFKKEYESMRFYSSRTHDWALWNAGQRIIDTHFIFPLMHLDPADPGNYYFKASDEIIRLCREAGSKIFYRLGTSIEHSGSGHFNTLPPEDFEQYAEVLAGIVRHYTAGWADGFHYDIDYWEIWNEADLGAQMWDGPFDDFVRFFVIVLKRLKREFPHLKIGGAAFCYFNEGAYEKLRHACDAAGVVPDFISWHCYTSNAKQLIEQPACARKKLDSWGWMQTELCINEWHYLISWDGIQSSASTELYHRAMDGATGLWHIDSAVFNLAVLAGWQDTPLDSAFYYGAGVDGSWGYRDNYRAWNKNYYSMRVYGSFVHEFTKKVEAVGRRETLFSLAAFNETGTCACLLLADYRGSDQTLEIEIKGMEHAKRVTARILDESHDIAPVPVIWHDGVLTLTRDSHASAAYLVYFDC